MLGRTSRRALAGDVKVDKNTLDTQSLRFRVAMRQRFADLIVLHGELDGEQRVRKWW